MKAIINKKRYIKARRLTLLYAVALVIGVFGVVAPSKAGSITAFDYLYGLYTWWQTGSTHNFSQVIHVRVTFQGGSATPQDTTGGSMGIFQGDVYGRQPYDWSAFRAFPMVASGSGIFYNVRDLSTAGSPLEGPYTVPFKLSVTFSQGKTALSLQLDLRSVWSNGGIQTFYFNQITSDNGFPWGNWIGLNGGVGSAQGQATLVCSVGSQAPPH
jgi:hypothetical protein